jgi:hypothetical protein
MNGFEIIGYDAEIDSLDDPEVDPYLTVVLDLESPRAQAALGVLPEAVRYAVSARFAFGPWSLSRYEAAGRLGISVEDLVILEREGVRFLQLAFGEPELWEAA